MLYRPIYNICSYATIVTLNLYVNIDIIRVHTKLLQHLIYTSIHRFANGGVQEALVNEVFLSLFIMFRTLKRPKSLRLRIYKIKNI